MAQVILENLSNRLIRFSIFISLSDTVNTLKIRAISEQKLSCVPRELFIYYDHLVKEPIAIENELSTVFNDSNGKFILYFEIDRQIGT